MTEPQTFAEWVDFFISHSGMAQAEIERRMQVSKGILSKWKNEDVDKPRRENLEAFANVLHLMPEKRASLLAAAGYQVVVSAQLDHPDYQAARERYLDALRRRYNVVGTHGFMEALQDEQVGRPRSPPLLGAQGVYVPLSYDIPPSYQVYLSDRVPDEIRKPGEPKRLRAESVSLYTVLQFLSNHLVFIGDAGSGKTTTLHAIVSILAAKDPHILAPDLALAVPDPRPLPIFVPLRLFESACAGGDDGAAGYTRCARDLLRFLDDWFSKWCPEANLDPGFLADHVRAGRAWLLLDALGEVPDAVHRQTVRNVIEELAEFGSRLIVTARVAAYRGAQFRDLFVVVHVRPLDDEQRTQMVQAIYRGLALPDARRRAEDLAVRFAQSDTLRDLTRTPVMVWTAAVIHALRGELPDSRAALYDVYVDVLLKQSYKRSRHDVAAVDVLVSGEGFPLSDRREYLIYAAFAVHRTLGRHPERRGREGFTVGEDELADDLLADYFERELFMPRREARRRAREYVTLMVERSGLLYETSDGYTIGDHLTMQEYLAGCYLGEYFRYDDGYESFLHDAVDQSWWRQVLLLAAGHLAAQRSSEGKRFLREIAGQGETPAQQLDALALAGRGLLQLRARQRRPNWYAGLACEFANRLGSLLYEQEHDAPAVTRQEAGLVLGLLYGMPEELGSVKDPRFVWPLGLPAFVPIAAGTFWMGEEDSLENERPRHCVFLEAYELACCPTTNAMYAHFIVVGGYADEQWWPEAIQDGYWKEGKVHDWLYDKWYDLPRYWHDERWNNPAQPVVGVNWYEAVAFCHWLTATLADGYTYRLPSEAEWERAARGRASLLRAGEMEEETISRYPWGDAWRDDFCNSNDARLEATSPVELFPRGAAHGAEGAPIHDMVGNVYEWCWDWYGEAYYTKSQRARNPRGPESGDQRVLRGGSWYDDKDRCRCGYRHGFNPGGGVINWGFRCARTLYPAAIDL